MSKKISEAEMLETPVEDYLVDQVENQLGGEALKLEVRGRRGWLDRLIILPRGITAYVETKRPVGGRLSVLQRKRIARLEELGHFVYVLSSHKEVNDWVQEMEDLYDGRVADAAQGEETFPSSVVDALIAGVHPIKVFRLYRGLTQIQLAKLSGTSPVYISQIECGQRNGSVRRLKCFAGALGVTLDDLV